MSNITISRKQAVLALGAIGAAFASNDLRPRLEKKTVLQVARLMDFTLEELLRQGIATEGTIGNLLELAEFLAQALKEKEPAE